MGLRARNIKPGFFRNEVLATLPMATRLFFIGLWCVADREGRFEYRPKRLRVDIFPYDEAIEVELCVQQLVESGFVQIYAADGYSCQIGQILNFKKHQAPHHTEKKSALPAAATFTVSPPLTHGEPHSDSLIPDSPNPDSLSGSAVAHTQPGGVPRACKFPREFRPNGEHRTLAVGEGLDLDKTFLKFTEYHEAKGTKYVDWAKVSNWIRNEHKFRGEGRSNGRKPSTLEIVQRELAIVRTRAN